MPKFVPLETCDVRHHSISNDLAEIKTDLKEINTTLTNHVLHIREDMSSLKTRVEEMSKAKPNGSNKLTYAMVGVITTLVNVVFVLVRG